ncbi:MAG: hypothetical protein CSB47_06340 [Proteobacteria bacterium]|nr:MAG: hypothetical protein CSB47_06340 [Pseudomonadota bacterium]
MSSHHSPLRQRRSFPTAPTKQRGAALLIALVIMSIAMGIAVNIMFRQQLHTRLAVNISNLEQIYPYATGLEDWARTILNKDAEDSPDTDDLTEAWATEIPPIPIPGGVMTGRLFDLQARLNLNNLYPPERPITEDEDEESTRAPLTEEERRIRADQNRYIIAKLRTEKLLQTIDTEEKIGPARNFADMVTDWIDGDSNTSETGAESDYYQTLDPPYNAADSLLVNETELRLLKGIDKEAFELLRPYICVLPEYTAVNVNTASMEVFQALGFTPEAAENIISVRDENPFQGLNDFMELEVVRSATEGDSPEVYQQFLSATTDYFLLQGEINIGTARLYINSILHRKDGKVTVVSRDFSNQQIVKAKE